MSNLIRWSPFEEMNSLHRDMDRIFGHVFGDRSTRRESRWMPATESVSSAEGWTLRMALPGVNPKDVRIDLGGRVLTVSGERGTTSTRGDRQMSEIGYGRFERSFTLPESVEADKVTAKFEHGMLELTLPLGEAAKPRRIEVAEGTSAAEKVA